MSSSIQNFGSVKLKTCKGKEMISVNNYNFRCTKSINKRDINGFEMPGIIVRYWECQDCTQCLGKTQTVDYSDYRVELMVLKQEPIQNKLKLGLSSFLSHKLK